MITELAVPRQLPNPVCANAVLDLAPPSGLIRVPGVARYLVTRGEEVRIASEPGTTEADVACFREGPVRALQFLLDGVFALRGAAVAIGSSAVVICGPPATGKSALAAALALRGHAVLADKLVPVSADGDVTPTTDAVELWPPMAKHLDVLDRPNAVVRPALAKCAYRLGPDRAPSPLTTGLIVLLAVDPRCSGPTINEVPPGVQRVRVVASCQAHRQLVAHLNCGIEQLDWVSRLAAFPMMRLSRPRHALTVGALADLVEKWSA